MGLVHMNGRIYDPLIGRVMSADPIVSHPGYSQSFNRYAYVWNNPLRYTDPSGFDPTITYEWITGSDGNLSLYRNYDYGPDPYAKEGHFRVGASGRCPGWHAWFDQFIRFDRGGAVRKYI